MKKFFFAALIITAGLNVFACLNIYYSVDKEGHFHETQDYREKFIKNFDQENLEGWLLKTEKRLRKEKSYKVLSDYAVYLMKAGRVEESQELLVALCKAYPEEYQLAANLGTAYELNGNPDSALVYIKRGMELNPKAHGGSEWVHVKILETKIKLRDEPGYLEANTVLQLTDEQEKDIKVCDQLLIQLHERFPFSPEGNDPIMASLFVDLGDCYANSVSIEYARAYYELAQKYYGDTSAETSGKRKEMERLSKEYQTLTTTINENGDNNKESYRPYDRVMADSDGKDHEINWSAINTNVDSLLSYVGLERVIIEPIDTAALPASEEQVPAAEPAKPSEDERSMAWFWIMIAGVITLPIILAVRKKRKLV
jgi:tetratricopeptide (TPR) repeat protein